MRMEHTTSGILDQVADRLVELLVYKDFEFAELFTGLAGLLWGLWLLNPAWNSFASTTSFRAMAQLANENVWGGGMALIGLIQLWSLIRDQFFWRRRASALLCMLWAFIAVMLVRANPAGTGTVIYPLLSLSAAWAHWRMRAGRL